MYEGEDQPGTRLIPGYGPRDAEGMLVGEAGGRGEHFARRPFVGKAGDVLTTYCRSASLTRNELYITNLWPYWPGPEPGKTSGNRDPSPEEIKAEEWRLIDDLKEIRPRVIGTIGRLSTRWFLGDVDITDCHGIPHWSEKAPGSVILPIVHPAAGFYEPNLAAFSQEDFMRFGYYLRNPVDVRKVPKIKVVYHEEAPVEIRDAAVDTEGLEDSAWGMSWSYYDSPNVAHVWIYKPGKRVPRLAGWITFQNALHDLVILRAMGIDTTTFKYHDTMIQLFNLQLEPQGLKPAAYRHLGLRMQDFDGVVRPHFNQIAVPWLMWAGEGDYPKPRPVPIKDYAKRRFRVYRPWSADRRIKSLLRSFEKDYEVVQAGGTPEKPVRLEKRWADLGKSSNKKEGEAEKVDNTELYHAQAERWMQSKFPNFSIFCVPHEEAVQYSGTDASATCLLKPKLDILIKSHGLEDVYEMDRAALPFVDRMQEVGMRVDVKLLRELEADLEVVRDKAMKKVQRVVGDRWFNPGSSDQVAGWLYSYKGLPILTETEAGRGSTKDSALKMLRGYHSEDEDVAEFIDNLDAYREADKILGTFVIPIFGYLKRDKNGDWRLHANFRVTRVVSGRLSSHEPNVLALPTRTELGKRIRLCFVAAEGFVLVDADLSQIELRTMADHCRDRRMRDAFENDEDLHSITASIIFKIPLAKVAKDSPQRYVAKTINFAVMYGISARALLEQLYKASIFDFTLEDCERFIIEWFRIYGSVREYLKRVWAQAARDGFVRDMWGRKCYVPNLRVNDTKMVEAAQRLAGNFPIQGGAHGLVKRAEARLDRQITDGGLREDIKPWLQMHDELLLEVRKRYAEEAKVMVVEAMTADHERLRVPIKADAAMGQSWGSAKK